MLELPDPVFRLAEAKAEELGIPVQQLVAEIVEEKLRPPEKPWMAGFGKLAHLHDETERINRIIEEEFEQIEPEE
jgi:hypothetical protein